MPYCPFCNKYVSLAEDLEEQFNGKTLFNIALKPHNILNVEGKQDKQVTFNNPQKEPSIESNYKEKTKVGLAEPLPSQQIYLLSIDWLFWLKRKYSLFTKTFFSFLSPIILPANYVFSPEESAIKDILT